MGEHASVEGRIAPGNIDLKTRPKVRNKDGSYSTVRSISFSENGREILIPTVVGNKVVSNDAAIQRYHKTGRHLGIFKDVASANRYAEKLHSEQERIYGR